MNQEDIPDYLKDRCDTHFVSSEMVQIEEPGNVGSPETFTLSLDEARNSNEGTIA